MLVIANKLSSICFSELMEVYREGNLENGEDNYPHLSQTQKLMRAEQDFYQYLNEVFFCTPGSQYALWECEGHYMAALRLEPYRDGLLLSALETRPDARHRGYASELVSAVIEHLSQQGSGTLYSHVSKRNAASLALHHKCGFQTEMDYAVYLDGSVMQNLYTLVRRY